MSRNSDVASRVRTRRDAFRVPEVVAHRGYAARYPENTLRAIRAALEAGARHVEFDLQLSADGVPLLMHDAELSRTAGRAGIVAELIWAELAEVDVSERPRLGEQFAGVRVPSLREAVSLLERWPEVTAFAEIKRSALGAFGVSTVIEKVLAELAPLGGRAVVISFDARAIETARDRGAQCVGWVIDRWNAAGRALAASLQPDYLFCNFEKLPPAPEPLWPGPWEWVLYEVTDPALARSLAARGVRFVETMAVGELLAALASGEEA